jgi:recombination protein RecT
MNEAAVAVRDEPVPLMKLRRELEERAEEFRMVLPSHISPQKLQRVVLTAVQLNPDLLACDRRSFLTSCMKAAQDGLLPDGREAAIVPFKTRVKDAGGWRDVRLAQYLPMVFGLRKKILQSAEVTDIFAAVVYRQEIERGLFHYEEGSERTLRHRPLLDPDFAPTDADIALAYSVATLADGFKSFEVMRRGELDRVREASQTGATRDHKGEPREPKGPWRDWFSEMAKKTVIRRHSKSLPQSGDIILTDVEQEDIERAARSTVALLDSRRSEPSPLIDDGGEAFDPETGEVARPEIVAEGFDPATEAIRRKVDGEPEPEFVEPPPAPERKPKSRPIPESKPTAPPETKEPEPDGTDDAAFDEPEASDAELAAAPKDDVGVTKTDEEILAEGYMARARGCDLLVDLRTLERMAFDDLNRMAEERPELATAVDTEFAKARKRLTPPGKDRAS